MKISKEQVAINRERILEGAARLFRERGFEGVTVAEIMQAAGLTHGAFYGHFASKQELIAEAMRHAMPHREREDGEAAIPAFARGYLSPRHRDGVGEGCAFAALGGEAARASPETRQVFTAAVSRQIESFARSAAGATEKERRRAAIATWATLLGGLVLARLVDDDNLSDEILAEVGLSLGLPDDQAPTGAHTAVAQAKQDPRADG